MWWGGWQSRVDPYPKWGTSFKDIILFSSLRMCPLRSTNPWGLGPGLIFLTIPLASGSTTQVPRDVARRKVHGAGEAARESGRQWGLGEEGKGGDWPPVLHPLTPFTRTTFLPHMPQPP